MLSGQVVVLSIQTFRYPSLSLLCFFSNFLFFVPLGFRLGQSLNKFENRLIAYAYDLLGSILGVACFTLLSYIQTAPFVWFSIGGLTTLFLLRKNLMGSKYYLNILYILIAIFATFVLKGEWSPYYRVWWESYQSRAENSKEFLGYQIFVDK